ncbi:protein kinase domain-containing protein [Nocardioides ultimimeridianus]
MTIPRSGELVGRYRIDRVVGEGGMGVVYAATDTRLGRTVALKVITGAHARDPEFRRRFQIEASVLAQIDSPHVIAISDHDEIDGLPFIVTQYVDGTDLGRILRESGPLPPRVALRIAAQVARGLAAAHRRGVIHRDIKPTNVLVRDLATPDMHAYLIDFGIAHDTASEAVTRLGGITGTWAYLAPERTRSGPQTPASDLYSLGCVLWQMLTGSPPYAGNEIEVALAHGEAPVPQLPATVPGAADLNPLLARLLAKDPADRPADATSARLELDRLAVAVPDDTRVRADPPTTHRPTATVPETRRLGRVRRRTVLAAGAVLVLAAGGLWGTRSLGGGTPGPRAAVKGDLDADGLGDALVLQRRADVAKPYATLLFRSTGTAFAEPAVSPFGIGTPAVGDPDGDGRDEVVWVAGGDSSLTVRVDGWQPWTWTPASPAEAELFADGVPAVRFADVTGDGRDDLVLRQVTADHRLVVEVAAARSNGFADPQQWYAGPVDPDGPVGADAVSLWPGDTNGDGRTDLLASWPTADGGLMVQSLVSTGTALTPGRGAPVTVPHATTLAGSVGDIDGDGHAELVLASARRGGVWVVRPGGPGQAVWTASASRSLPAYGRPTLSDVDGDGSADLVWVNAASPRHPLQVRLWVMRSHDGTFDDPALWGTWGCGDECHDRFRFVGN